MMAVEIFFSKFGSFGCCEMCVKWVVSHLSADWVLPEGLNSFCLMHVLLGNPRLIQCFFKVASRQIRHINLGLFQPKCWQDDSI